MKKHLVSREVHAPHDSGKLTAANRRSFLSQAAVGLGPAALVSLLSDDSRADELDQGVVAPLHHPARVKRVLHLCMAGGPSHLETFDEKPTLRKMHGQPMPETLTRGQQVAQLQGKPLNCFAPQFDFESYGDCGQRICSLFPHLGSVADDLCIIRSMYTDQINHDPAHTLFNTGSSQAGDQAWALGCCTVSVRSVMIYLATLF